MITQIKIEGYKSIKKLDLQLTPINILLGSNGVRKSNFISIFSLIKNIYNRNLQNYIEVKGGSDSFLHFGKKNTDTIKTHISFGKNSKPVNRFMISLEEAQDSLFISSIDTTFCPYPDTWHYQNIEKTLENLIFHRLKEGKLIGLMIY